MSVYWTLPVWMWPLLLIVAAGAIFWTRYTYRQTYPKARPNLMRFLIVLRTTALLVLLLAIAGPVISLNQTRHLPAEILVLLEDSGSMSIEDAGADKISRWEFAIEALSIIQEAFAKSDVPVQFTYLRGNGIQPAQEFRLDDAVIPDAFAHGTDLNRFVSEETKGKGRRVAATLLLSDGQQTVSERGNGVFGSNANIPDSPLFVLGVGDAKGSADRLITDLRYPDTAYAGDEILIQLAVSHRFTDGISTQDMVVRLTNESGELARQVVSSGALVQSLELEFIPLEEGIHVYELEVSPLDNERFQANNKVSLVIDVQKSRSRVLLLSEFPGWDVRFLAQAALREPRVDLQVVYAAAGGLVLADSMEPWQKPQNSLDWMQWDAVILTSWTGKLGRLDWVGLGEAVEQGMGLLVMAGGAIQTPQIRPLPAMPTALLELVPVTTSSWVWKDGSYFLREGGDLRGHPVLSGVAGGSTGLLLEELPPLPGVVHAQPKNGALVLLSGIQRNADPASDSAAVLVVSRKEMGPVAWLAGRRFWETAFWTGGNIGIGQGDPGEQPIVRLLRNLLVWISAGAQENGLAFTGHRTIFQAGERITLAAQWRNLRGQPLFDRSMVLLLEKEDGELGAGMRSFSFGAMDPQTGAADVELPVLPPGQYTVQLQGAGNPPLVGPKAELTILDHSVEDTQVRMDRRHLSQFASRLGGTFYEMSHMDVVDRLVSDIMAVQLEETVSKKMRRYDFWSAWPFLVLVCLLLGYEWFLRRRSGML